jgi:hypothetical protein
MDVIKGLASLALTALLLFASSPVNARFVSVDPVQANANNGQNFNRYNYCNNNPYRFKDPDGRQNEDEVDPDKVEELRQQQLLQPVSPEALMEPSPSLIPKSLADPLGDMRDRVQSSSQELNEELSGGNRSDGRDEGSQQASADRNPKTDQRLGPGEIKQLERAGHDAHDLKGGKNASRQDLFKDKSGNVYVKPKNGSGPGEPTGINLRDLDKKK